MYDGAGCLMEIVLAVAVLFNDCGVADTRERRTLGTQCRCRET